jgi:hypothetical protein
VLENHLGLVPVEEGIGLEKLFYNFNLLDLSSVREVETWEKRKRSTDTDIGGSNKKRFEVMKYIQRACFG